MILCREENALSKAQGFSVSLWVYSTPVIYPIAYQLL